MTDRGRACARDRGGGARRATRSLTRAIALTGAVFLAEFAGGIWSGSLALLADSLHVLFDAVALGLSYAALALAARPATDRHSFGLHRAEILAALVNGLALVLVALWIFHEAWERLAAPREVRVGGMLAIALFGLAANAVVIRILHGHHRDDLNVRGAYLHVLGDLLASIGVLVAGLVIWRTGWTVVDPVLSVGIGLLLLWGAGRLVWESLHILMEGVPRGLSVEQVAAAVRGLDGVADFHRVHIWSLCSHIRALSAHLVIDGSRRQAPRAVLDDVNALLQERFRISHTTVQTECRDCGQEALYCTPEHPEEPHRH